MDSIAVMIDGDSAALCLIAGFLAELRQRDRVVERRFFAEPRRLENSKWKSALDSNSIEFIPVPRGTDAPRNPNYDAINGQVRELLQSRRIGAIALLVSGTGYAPLVEEVVGAGRRCFVKFTASGPGMVGLFEKAGAQILAYDPSDSCSPKFTCVLHSDGTGSIRTVSDASSLSVEELEQDEMIRIKSQLDELGYRSSIRDPLLPSIAKFWFKNCPDDLIVFPGNYAAISLNKILRKRQHAKWAIGRRDLAFIFPRDRTATKKDMRDCGSQSCAAYVKAGIGPFILRDSSTLVQEMLRKIGYLDGGLNACFQEGLDVFASRRGHAREMRRNGIQYSDLDTMREKEENIRRFCLSESFFGAVDMPPGDGYVRSFFSANGLLKNKRCSLRLSLL